MASEISTSVSLSASKNGASVSLTGSLNSDLSGTEMISSVQQFGTSQTQISLGGCDQVQWLAIKNLDSTNSLRVGLNNVDPITQVISLIPPLGHILVCGCSTTLYAQSTAGTIDAFVACVET